jgi:hypothetical protein
LNLSRRNDSIRPAFPDWLGAPPCAHIRAILHDLARKERSMNPHERPVVTEANKVAVRAGSTGYHVRYVLIASCALVIMAFILIALLVKP